MNAEHHHEYEHRARSGREDRRRRILIALVLTAAYMAAEIAGGLLSDSLALLADAGHMLSDVIALSLSLFAMWIACRPATPRRSYGYYRAEILAALANGAGLVAISILIFVEAYQRLGSPPVVKGPLMLSVAAGGLAINLIAAWFLRMGKEENLNLRGAWLHALSDALGSVGAIAGGVLIWLFGWNWADPIASVAIGILIIYSSWMLIAESMAVLMEACPGHLDLDEVRDAMASVPGVVGVHDLHVWSITSGMIALSCHVIGGAARAPAELLTEIRHMLEKRFGIDHATLQIEPEGFEEGATHE